MKRRAIVGACLLAAIIAVPSGALAADTNWYSHGGSRDEGNYSVLDQINARTVGRLGLAWSLDLPGEVSLEATPLAIDGRLYFSGSSSDVYAVDARSGRVLWKYDPQVWRYRPEHLKLIWGINRSGGRYASPARIRCATTSTGSTSGVE